MKITDIEIARQLETPAPYTPDMTTTVGKLRHLRHVVERIPPERFNMDTAWGRSSCGTVGCMLGWATQDKHFQDMGLAVLARDPTPGSCIIWDVNFGETTDFYEAGAALFGVSNHESLDLFSYTQRHGDAVHMSEFTIAHGLARIDRMIEKYSAGAELLK